MHDEDTGGSLLLFFFPLPPDFVFFSLCFCFIFVLFFSVRVPRRAPAVSVMQCPVCCTRIVRKISLLNAPIPASVLCLACVHELGFGDCLL